MGRPIEGLLPGTALTGPSLSYAVILGDERLGCEIFPGLSPAAPATLSTRRVLNRVIRRGIGNSARKGIGALGNCLLGATFTCSSTRVHSERQMAWGRNVFEARPKRPPTASLRNAFAEGRDARNLRAAQLGGATGEPFLSAASMSSRHRCAPIPGNKRLVRGIFPGNSDV